jgi:DNA-binding NtrC family response regulator
MSEAPRGTGDAGRAHVQALSGSTLAEPEHDGTQPVAPAFEPRRSYRETRAAWEADFERRYVAWLLARHAGNISAAAREAEMDRKYLHRLAQKHGVHPGPRARR